MDLTLPINLELLPLPSHLTSIHHDLNTRNTKVHGTQSYRHCRFRRKSPHSWLWFSPGSKLQVLRHPLGSACDLSSREQRTLKDQFGLVRAASLLFKVSHPSRNVLGLATQHDIGLDPVSPPLSHSTPSSPLLSRTSPRSSRPFVFTPFKLLTVLDIAQQSLSSSPLNAASFLSKSPTCRYTRSPVVTC